MIINNDTTKEKAIRELKVNGYSTISNYLKDAVEMHHLKRKIYDLVCITAINNNVEPPTDEVEALDKKNIELNLINGNIGAFLNDTLNACPEMYRLQNSKLIINLAKDILNINDNAILGNNYRLRVQIPGCDNISNLPWHQDSHYNNFYKENNSVVIWVSITDIYEEMGPIVLKKGSHKLGKLPIKEYVRPNNQKIFTVDNKYITSEAYNDTSVTTKSGDLMLIDMNVIHRSGFNKSKNKIKFSAQGRYHNCSASGFLPQYLK